MNGESEGAATAHQRLLLRKIAGASIRRECPARRPPSTLKRPRGGRILGGVDAGAIVRSYMSRHQNRWSQALHLVGVPLAPITFVVLLALGQFVWAGAAFVAGYSLQWLGHRIEGNSFW